MAAATKVEVVTRAAARVATAAGTELGSSFRTRFVHFTLLQT